MKIRFLLLLLFLTVTVFGQKFTTNEIKLINATPAQVALKVIQITNPDELKILKSQSTNIDERDPNIAVLKQKMFLAMRSEANPGVGIAAPQVGINRNLIWVQRFDKSEKPFEFFINPKIIWKSELMRLGPEGCLSIPLDRSDVYRHYTIKINYLKDGTIIEEMVEGFTAVIFQHEIDHLNGFLFTDRVADQKNRIFVAQNMLTNFYIE